MNTDADVNSKFFPENKGEKGFTKAETTKAANSFWEAGLAHFSGLTHRLVG